MNNYIDILENCYIFNSLTKSEINEVTKKLNIEIKSFNALETIMHPEQNLEKLGIIAEGSIEVSKHNSIGDKITISTFSKYDVFGEVIALSTKYNENITVIALEETKIIFIDVNSIIHDKNNNLNSNFNTVYKNIISELANKAYILNKKIDYLSIKSMRGKIATFLYNMYIKENSLSFNIKLNRDELADFLNVSRPSMSRELSRMSEENIIRFNKYFFEILDINKLHLYVQ